MAVSAEAQPDPQETTALRARGVAKAFGATVALRDFDFDLRHGEIHALLGENGAGKSTFIKILAGVYTRDAGEISCPGPISFIHQDLALVPTMSVADNFGLVAGFETRLRAVDGHRLRRTARERLRQLGLELDPDTLVGELSLADRALVAIARAVHARASVLVLDEPTASLAAADVERLFDVLRSLRRLGVAIVYVSHRLAEVRALADRITVLRDGVRRATVTPDEVSESELATLIVGKQVESVTGRRRSGASRDALLSVERLTTDAVGPVALALAHGEVLACAGLRGAGHEQVGRALAGLTPWRGEVVFDGQPYRAAHPAAALRRSVAFLTGDRTQTLAADLTVTENLFMSPAASSRPGWVRLPGAERRAARELVRRFHVRPSDPDGRLAELSGGNAQKVVLARAVDTSPRLLILEEPTAGVDVGSRGDFYRLVREVAADGVGVLLTSSDYEEVAEIADRALVFGAGQVIAELHGDEITPEALSAAAMGGQPHA